MGGGARSGSGKEADREGEREGSVKLSKQKVGEEGNTRRSILVDSLYEEQRGFIWLERACEVLHAHGRRVPSMHLTPGHACSDGGRDEAHPGLWRVL